MADLYSNTGDGNIHSGYQSSWANARDHVGATRNAEQGTTSAFVAVVRQAARGGGINYIVYRSFYYFDTSGITSTVNSATFKIAGLFANDASCIAVKSTAFGGDGGTALAASDFNNITGFSTGASLAGSATDYSATILTTAWDKLAGYNDLASTASLRTDMQNDDVVIICVMDYTNDYLNSALTSNASLNYGAYYTDNIGTSKDPYIEYELATGYGNAVSGVASGNIGKIDGIATANIEKVIGV